MRRGDLYLAELQPRSGSELKGVRPVVVLSRDSFNLVETWSSVVVVPLSTSERQARRGPTAVPIPDGAGGLRGAGVAVCHQVTTINRTRLTRRLGNLPTELVTAVGVGVNAALDLP